MISVVSHLGCEHHPEPATHTIKEEKRKKKKTRLDMRVLRIFTVTDDRVMIK